MGAVKKFWGRSGLGAKLGPPARALLTLLASFWIIEVVDFFWSYPLDNWGIRPRSISGLPGVICSPFLHGGFGHLAANTIPLFVLGMLVSLRGIRHWVQVTFIIVLLGGAGVWLFGWNSDVIHIGASGLIFGYFGYLLFRGIFDRSVRSLLVGVVVLLLYGGLIWGVLPSAQTKGVSWEGHLFGFLSGIVAAKLSTEKSAGLSGA